MFAKRCCGSFCQPLGYLRIFSKELYRCSFKNHVSTMYLLLDVLTKCFQEGITLEVIMVSTEDSCAEMYRSDRC